MKTLTIMTILLLVMLCSFSYAQINIFDLEILNANAQVFPLGDLDFTNTGLVTNYFIIRMQNGTGGSPVNMRLQMVIRYNGFQIAIGTSNQFILPANGVTYSLTSQQLAQGTAMVNGQPIELGDYEVDLDLDPPNQNLQEQAIQTGAAPSGTYEFILTGIDPNNQQIIIDTFGGNNTITITNPTYIILVIPGNSVNDPMIIEIATLYPYFQWQTDVQPGNQSYDIFVYQKYPGDVSVQDVLNHPPMLQVEDYPNNFLQYPTDTAPSGQFVTIRPLEAGNTYYWFVRSRIQGPTGDILIDSDISRFRVSDLTQGGNNAQQIIAILQQMLGLDFEQALTNLIEQGFDPNGDISLDGQSGDMGTLLDIANQVASGELNIEDVEIY